MDVKAFPSGQSSTAQKTIVMDSTTSNTKKQNFIIQESLIFNKGQISSYSPKAGPSQKQNNAVKKSNTIQRQSGQAMVKDKLFLKGLKTSLNQKMSLNTVPFPEIENKVVGTKNFVPSTSVVKSTVAKATKAPKPMEPLTKKPPETDYMVKKRVTKNITLEFASGCKTDVDYEAMIPTTSTAKKPINQTPREEITISSEVSMFPTSRNNPKKITTQKQGDAITISHANKFKPQQLQMKSKTQKIQLQTINTNVANTTKTKYKKKKRRFRNMDGSDEEDWTSEPSSLQTYVPTALPCTPKLVSAHTLSQTPSTATKAKEKIQILQEFIFPSPQSQQVAKKPEKIIAADKGDECDNSINKINSKISVTSALNVKSPLNVDKREPSASTSANSVTSKASQELTDESQKDEQLVLNMDDDFEAQPGEIFCAYDDEGNLVCLQKTESGDLIMLPTEQIDQMNVENAVVDETEGVSLNNNSFEVESKEELPEVLNIKKTVDNQTKDLTSYEHALLNLSPDSSPIQFIFRDGEDTLLASDDDEVKPNEPSVVENIGNEEIIAESLTPPEEEVVLPTDTEASETASVAANNEPIYILNENDQVLTNATPLKLAFLETLGTFEEALTAKAPAEEVATEVDTSILISTKRKRTKTLKGQQFEEEQALALLEEAMVLGESVPGEQVMLTQIETLITEQNQCSIEEYVPSDDSDSKCLNDSINSVNSLSQMDIAKMVLGEGFGAVLVSDQDEAVDLLQLPPDYEQKPLVAVSIAPLKEGTDVDEKATTSPVKQKRAYRKKKLGVTSTPVQKQKKSPKKKFTPQVTGIRHITGDCDVSPQKKTSPTKTVLDSKEKTPNTTLSKRVKQKYNGGLREHGNSDSEVLDTLMSNQSEGDLLLNSGHTTDASFIQSSQSEASVLSPILFEKKMKKRGRKPKKRNLKRKSDENNSSKENNSLDELGAHKSNESAGTDSNQETLETVNTDSVINSKDDSLRDDISLGETSACSVSYSDDMSVNNSNKKQVKSRRQRKFDVLTEPRVTRNSVTRKSLSGNILQVNLSNSEICISVPDSSDLKGAALQENLSVTEVNSETPKVCDAKLEVSEEIGNVTKDLEVKSEALDIDTASDADKVIKTDDESQNIDAVFKTPNMGKSKKGKSSLHKKSKHDKTQTPKPNGALNEDSIGSAPATPKSSKKSASSLPFKINFKNLMSPKNATATPSSGKKHKHKKNSKHKESPKHVNDSQALIATEDIKFDPDLEIKEEPEDVDEPKVPKIILKLSPHTSPSIVRSPSCSPKKLNKSVDNLENTPRSKQKVKKRKILSPTFSIDEADTISEVITSPRHKQKKFSGDLEKEDGDVANVSVPLLTDDPELIINLPIVQTETEGDKLGDVEVKTEMVDYDDGLDQFDADSFVVGDLVFARLGQFCYWPCMVTLEPDSQKYRVKSKKSLRYHVRFFGDNGRRAWVVRSAILRYIGPNTLSDYQQDWIDKKAAGAKGMLLRTAKSEIAACTIKQNAIKTWTIGMNELTSLVDKTVAQRHEFFFYMFASKREKARKRKRQLTENDETDASIIKQEVDLVIKQESDVTDAHTDNLQNCVDVAASTPPAKKRKIESPKQKQTPKQNKKFKKAVSPAAIKETTERRSSTRSCKSIPSSTSITSESPKDSAISAITTNEQKRNYVIEDLELIIKGSMGMDKKEEPVKEENLKTDDVTEEDNNPREIKRLTRRRTQRKSSDAKKTEDISKSFKTLLKSSLHTDAAEVSDTDSSSKVSVQSASNKRTLFKDAPRNPVCQVCYLSSGTVLKCKGVCFGYYHPDCTQLKAEPKEEEELQLPPVLSSPKSPSTPKSSAPNVEIVSAKKNLKYFDKNAVNLNESDIGGGDLELIDQLDNKLSKVMAPLTSTTLYPGSTTDYTSSEESGHDLTNPIDVDVGVSEGSQKLSEDFVCITCKHGIDPPCFSCQSTVYLEKHVERFRCSVNGCGKYFHKECLKTWPQSVVSLTDEAFSYRCPMHICQTCTSENPQAATYIEPMSKTVRCLKCPATYHVNSFCVPAGTEILSQSQIICPRHVQHKGKRYTINANWCFICSRGGDLMCCETCPTSVHSECISINLRADDTFVCDDCESGRLPLYDEIVWAKFAHFKWWPGVVLFPDDIPENVQNFTHKSGEFVVRFFGTHDHCWFALGRVFLFHEDDKGDSDVSRADRKDNSFLKAVEEAKTALQFKNQLKKQRDLARNKNEKPPPYVRIRINRCVGSLKPSDFNMSNTGACNCSPEMPSPCGSGSDCLNRLLLTECDVDVCPAGKECQNQRFEKRLYPPLMAYKTESRGWGLKSSEPIFKGQFVIEYVGEILDQEEYRRRIERMNEQKAKNYYFLTLDAFRTLDAGPKGNLARFMNHCCKPNCETQKWTVKGDTRIGLFALEDIPANTELTFNYNMERFGERTEICCCGAENCSGFLGVKSKEVAKPSNNKKKSKKITSTKRLQKKDEIIAPVVPCFICGEINTDVDCTMKNCGKVYHIKCLPSSCEPLGKWTCPKHYCITCSKRTYRSCVKCLKSYCPTHANGNIIFQKDIGYLCNKHNHEITSQEVPAESTSSMSTLPLKQDVS